MSEQLKSNDTSENSSNYNAWQIDPTIEQPLTKTAELSNKILRNPHINLAMNGRELGEKRTTNPSISEKIQNGEPLSDNEQKLWNDDHLLNPKITEKFKNDEPLSDEDRLELLVRTLNTDLQFLPKSHIGNPENGTAAEVETAEQKYLKDVYNALFQLDGENSATSIDLITGYLDNKYDEWLERGDFSNPEYGKGDKAILKNFADTKAMLLALKSETSAQNPPAGRPEQRETPEQSADLNQVLNDLAQIEQSAATPAEVDDILVQKVEANPDDLAAGRAAVVESALEKTFNVNMPQGTPIERIITDTSATEVVKAAENTFSGEDKVAGSTESIKDVIDEIIATAQNPNAAPQAEQKPDEPAEQNAENTAEQERQQKQQQLFDLLNSRMIGAGNLPIVRDILRGIAAQKNFTPEQLDQMNQDLANGRILLDNQQLQSINNEMLRLASVAPSGNNPDLWMFRGNSMLGQNAALARASMQRILQEIFAHY
jgi:hypothetical protein